MSVPARERLVLEPIADDPEVGRWLAALEDGRRDTLRELETVRPEMLDWRPDAPLNSIGTLLYHVALVEASWLLEDIFEGDAGPDWLPALLPFEDRDGSGPAHPGRWRDVGRAPRTSGRDPCLPPRPAALDDRR